MPTQMILSNALSLVIAMMLLLAGCAPRTQYHFQFLGELGDLPSAIAAADEWNACGVVTATVSVDRSGDDDTRIYEVPSIEGGYSGYTDAALNRIRYVHQSAAAIQPVLAHEMGHVFGLPHYNDPNSIMLADTRRDSHVTQADCDRLNGR